MITIQNNDLTLKINPLGGEWTSIVDANHQEHLFQGHHASWSRQAPLLFPIVGRLLDHQYHYQNQTFEMGQHGFLRDMTLEVVSIEPTSVVLKTQANDATRRQYPFDFEVLITYELEATEIKTTLEVINRGDKSMYYGIGGHPAFIINPLDDNYLEIEGDELGEFILDGPYVRDYQPLTTKKFLLKEVDLVATKIISQAPQVRLVTPTKTITLKMDPTKYIGIWAPFNSENNRVEDCVALEPWWGMADCIDHNKQLVEKKAIMSLEPQQSQQFKFSINIQTIV
ncbi:MAG TPA: aldose 1-epimerase family protein [Erysipelothrix sp.]|nr:aldose 1-epimerase family protein [Erysipelothrix sp.]